jgi:D-lactate dehydrogenase
MRVAVFDIHGFEREYFEAASKGYLNELVYFQTRLTPETVQLAFGFDVVCSFVNDQLNEEVLNALKIGNVKLIALRSAGFNHVDLAAAERLGLPVVRVPEYSPHAVAEYAIGLMLCLNRKIHRAHQRVREGNFSLEGLVGFDLYGKTVGVIGTGQIGSIVTRILSGFGCRILANDLRPNEELIRLPGVQYVELDQIYRESDIISLHVPLTPETQYILNAEAFSKMKVGVMIINTGRGALIDTREMIQCLKRGQVGYAGLDVYEEEDKIFFQDLSEQVLQDDIIARLMTFPNVLITAHQGFLTHEALRNIAETTLRNISEFEEGKLLANEVRPRERFRKVA